jgi:hypothetical protein
MPDLVFPVTPNFQFYRNVCIVSASERDGLKGSLANFGFRAVLRDLTMCLAAKGWSAVGLFISIFFILV